VSPPFTFENEQAVSHPVHDEYIVIDDQNGLIYLTRTSPNSRCERDPSLDIQKGGGLVEEVQVGLAGETQGDTDALEFTAREVY